MTTRSWLLVLGVLAGCGQTPEPEPDAEEPSRREPEVRKVSVETERGTETVTVTMVGGRMIFEGDIEIPMHANGATIAGHRWTGRIVPYVVDAGLAYKDRVTQAIAHWESKTSLRFTARTNEADYIRFVPGRGCSSPVGRVGGAQSVVLAAGDHVTSIVGADFARSDNRAHYWYRSGYRTVGRSSDPDEFETHSPYVVPAGKKTTSIVDIAFAAGDQVYTWYRDGTFSIGTPSDLGATQAPQPFALPAGLDAWDVVGLAIAPDGHVHAWYSNGTTSEGTATNLGAHVAPRSFSLPSGRTVSELLAFGIANDSHAYAWFSAGIASAGSSVDLGSFRAPYDVRVMGHCGTPQAIHELGHAVGFHHEQTRLDRDQFVTINWSNIKAGHDYNFSKHTSGNDHGAYDYDSVMHYDSYAFSKNGQPTITKKNGGLIDDPSVLSPGDVAAVGWMYP